MSLLVAQRTAAVSIADKRQKWIDDLRGDVAKYISITYDIRRNLNGISLETTSHTIDALVTVREELHHRIGLRLNITEPKHRDIRRHMRKIDESMLADSGVVEGEIEKIAELAGQILKEEWDRVKNEIKYPDTLFDGTSKPASA